MRFNRETDDRQQREIRERARKPSLIATARFMNPKGILYQSPRLRGTSYLGSRSPRHFQPQRGCGQGRTPQGKQERPKMKFNHEIRAKLPQVRAASWIAPAERSGDGAFVFAAGQRTTEFSHALESGVALRFPPQSKISPRSRNMRMGGKGDDRTTDQERNENRKQK